MEFRLRQLSVGFCYLFTSELTPKLVANVSWWPMGGLYTQYMEIIYNKQLSSIM